MDHGMADRFRFVASGVLSGRGSQICCYVRLKSDFVSPVVKEDSQRISETCRHVPPFRPRLGGLLEQLHERLQVKPSQTFVL